MKFQPIYLSGAFVIKMQLIKDNRGSFSRIFCKDAFKKKKLNFSYPQLNNSENFKAGTLRGMHMQKKPMDEVKLVRCTKGKIFDVIVDFRKKSKTFLKWYGTELSETNNKMLYVPSGFLHGYLTLSKNSSVSYLVSKPYSKELEFGLRYDDPMIKINWPKKIKLVSKKDLSWPLLVLN